MTHPLTDPLLIAIAAPLAAAVLLALDLPRRWVAALACAGFLVPALAALHVWWHFGAAPKQAGYAFLSEYGVGVPSLGIGLKLGLNGVALPLFVLAGLVGLAAGIVALRSGAERLRAYLMLLLVMQAGLMGMFASVDLFFFYFFHELALIPTFVMVGIWGGRDRTYAAMMLTVYLTVGAMLSLLGLIAIYVKAGAHSFDLVTLREVLSAHPLRATLQVHIFGLLLFGFGILVSLWPFHTWAPPAYGAAPSSVAMLHAGVLKKFGLYGLIQVALPLLPSGFGPWAHLLAGLAVFGNVVVVGLVAIAQRDLKQMIAYSSVMHMGYAFLGIACFSVLGVGGAVMLMVGHGLSVALLFLLATSIHHRTKTFALDRMGGLARSAPVLAAFFAAATFAGIGLPGFANFWGELTIFLALARLSTGLAALAILGIVISAVYGLRALARVFYGPPNASVAGETEQVALPDMDWGERLPALILLAALLFIGFWPRSISGPINSALEASPAFALSAGPTAAASSQAPR
jgi:NADH-quinone oxidoreductase subunit M